MQEEVLIRKLVDYLHDNNIQQYVSLPQIAVMGDTSSGKSSLLSAISKVQFPSNDQLTTRCPTRLHMTKSRDGKTSVKVEINWHHTSDYKEGAHFESPFMEGKEALNKIPDYIEEAQEYIINLSNREVAFDVINVSITDPDALDLTLIDLPGFVRSVGRGESTQIVKDIEALNQEYLDNERCIILAIIPANVDFHNSQIMADALRVDPTTKRTIPVITKPDLIDSGAERGVLELLEGRKTDDFELGFHIVKCRGQAALTKGTTIDQGIREEENFFRVTEPWKNSADREKFGVVNLKKKLASLQVEMLKETVPAIIKEIGEKKQKAIEEIGKMGEDLSSDSKRREIFSSIERSLVSLVKDNVEGSKYAKYSVDGGFTFRSFIEKLFREFKDKLLASKLNTLDTPAVGDKVTVLTEEGYRNGKVVYKIGDKIQVHPNQDRDADYFFTNVVDHALRVNKEVGDCVEIFWKEGGSSYIKVVAVHSGLKQGQYDYIQYKDFSPSDVTVDNTPWLLEKIEKFARHDLPVFLSVEVFTMIVASLIRSDWQPFVTDLTNKIFNGTEEFIHHAIQETSSHSTPEMCRWFTSIMEKIIKTLKDKTTKEVLKIIEEEATQPYTQNHYLYDNVARKRNAKLLERLDKLKTKLDGKDAVLFSAIESLFKESQEKSMEQHVAEEMEIILIAYGKVATKRVMDQIPMAIEREFFKELLRTIPQSFKATDAQLTSLLNESQVTRARRVKLQEKILTFENAQNQIEQLLGFR